jgi:hypothetical protein
MKPTLTVRSLAGLVILTGLLLAQPAFASGKPYRNPVTVSNNPEEVPAKKDKNKSKNFASLNNSSVKIHPATVKREMHVVAKENDGAEVDFFVFDLQGTIIQHYKMKPKSHYKLSGLRKGKYTFSVFQGDEETASGKFEIR